MITDLIIVSVYNLKSFVTIQLSSTSWSWSSIIVENVTVNALYIYKMNEMASLTSLVNKKLLLQINLKIASFFNNWMISVVSSQESKVFFIFLNTVSSRSDKTKKVVHEDKKHRITMQT